MKIKIVFVLFVLLALGWFGITYDKGASPKVSVLMLTYERANVLSEAVDSILNQTYKDFELVIVNDGSTDNTDEVVENYAKKDKRIRYYKNRENKGIPFSRNRALSLSRGEYVMFMDDDDFSYPTRLEKQVMYLEKRKDIDVVVGQIEGGERVDLEHDNIVSYLISFNNIGNVNIMFRNDFVKKHKIKFDESFVVSEDWDFWLQMAFNGAKFGGIEDVVLKRNWKSKKFYNSSNFETNNPQIRKKIGLFFSPKDSEIFYRASSCRKLFMIKRKNIISDEFYKKSRTANNCF